MRTLAFLILAGLLAAAHPASAKDRSTADNRILQSAERSQVTNTRSSAQKRTRDEIKIDGSSIRVEQLIPDICKGCS